MRGKEFDKLNWRDTLAGNMEEEIKNMREFKRKLELLSILRGMQLRLATFVCVCLAWV